MLRIHRTEERLELDQEGRPFTLVSESWTIGVAAPWLGIGWSYHRPRSVEGESGPTHIRDHLMMARLVAVLAVAVSVLIRRRQP